MKEKLQVLGGFALAIVGFFVAVVLAVFFIKGGVWLSEKILPTLATVSGWTFAACLLILVPLAVFHPTRAFAGTGLYISSYVFGTCLWVMGLLLTYKLWGMFAVLLGLFFAGIGVVPFALIATMLNGLWSTFFILVFMLITTYGSRLMALYVLDKHEDGGSS